MNLSGLHRLQVKKISIDLESKGAIDEELGELTSCCDPSFQLGSAINGCAVSDAQGQVGESSVAVEVLADAHVGDDVIGAGHT